MSDLTEKGILAGRNGNWEMAAALFESATKEGDPEAVFELAECYFYGEGKPQDYAKAASLYERAYPDGNRTAYEKLAECFRMRRDGLQSEALAEQFEKEAERIGREEQSSVKKAGINAVSLINSEAVRDHLRKTGKEFSPLETAWLIRHNRYMWLEKKCRAWEELIRTAPDCEVPERRNCAYFPSLHGMLRDYIALCRELTERLRKKEAGTVYELSGHEDGLGWWRNPALYPSYEDCVQAAEESCDGSVNAVRIRKLRLGTGEQIMALFDNTLHLKEIDAAGLPAEEDKLLHGPFDGMWFDFPVPFSRGDILWDPDPVSGTGPFVLTSAGVSGIVSESVRQEMIRIGDGTDMAAWGVFQGEDGSLYNDIYYNWMDLEYYPGPYEREERALKALSDLRKGRIDEVAFAAVCHAVMMQNLAETTEAKSLCTGYGTGIGV